MGEFLRTSVSDPPVANPGLIRPPRIYLAAIALGLLGHALWGSHIVRRTIGAPIGTLLALAAVALYVSAVRSFKAAGTPVPGNQPTTAIVRAGPYRYTRNPIYLAFTLLHLGLALLANSERYLAARFPSEYASYKASVRRWL
jgi:protein-S-isoprenylcysteine O-methyltransferase Ste14